MYKSLIALAVLGAASVPAMAQTPQAPQTPQVAPVAPAKPQMVKKTVCTRVIEEETTGSRLGTAPKKCKTIEVEAGGGAKRERAPSANSDERG